MAVCPDREPRYPRRIKTGRADNGVDLVVASIVSYETILGDSAHLAGPHGDVWFYKCLKKTLAWCRPPTTDGKVFGNDRIRYIRSAAEFPSHFSL